VTNLQDAEFIVLDVLKDFIKEFLYLNGGIKLRAVLKDNSFVDIYLNPLEENSFSFHFQCKDGRIFRLDTYPGEKRAKTLSTYPVHLHYENQNNVIEPPFKVGRNSLDNLRNFLEFITEILNVKLTDREVDE
jgi:hypothetical protein